jgi:hypothetical protein
MRGRVLVVCSALMGLILWGCSGPGSSAGVLAGREPVVLVAVGEAILEQAGMVVPTAQGWDYFVEASAEGLPAAGASTPMQVEFTAVEAAKYRAMSKLVERLEGLRVARESSVLDLQFLRECVEARTCGELQGVRVVGSSFDAGTGVARVTVQMGLDQEGNIVPESFARPVPASPEARRARCEHAARVDAMARLRERVGEVYVAKHVTVHNLMLERHEACSRVEGMLRGVTFEAPVWVSDERCVVEASIVLDPRDLAVLGRMAEFHGEEDSGSGSDIGERR